MTRRQVKDVVKRIAEATTPSERVTIAGMESSRADIIVGGAVILDRMMSVLGVDEIAFSDYALREGALFDLYQRTHGGSTHHLSSLRRRSVEQLMGLCDDDPDHSHHVARLALRLFDELQSLHGLDDASRELLEAGALLSNVGLFVSHSRHHHHSYYVIRNSEHLSGFNDHEIEIIAQVARYHRRGVPSTKHREFAALDPSDQERVRRLAGVVAGGHRTRSVTRAGGRRRRDRHLQATRRDPVIPERRARRSNSSGSPLTSVPACYAKNSGATSSSTSRPSPEEGPRRGRITSRRSAPAAPPSSPRWSVRRRHRRPCDAR